MAKDPVDVPCEWCEAPSVIAVEQMKKIKHGWVSAARFKYACEAHKHLAEELKYVKKR